MSKPRAHLIANSKSGKGKGLTLAQDAQKICDELGYELINYEIKSPDDFIRQSKIAVQKAEQDGGVVIAAGGDGTIRGVAEAARGKKIRFAAVPCGTFNFFARNHNIPEDSLEAFRLALTGTPRPVRLGEMNGHIFLINASLGLYAKAIHERKARTKRFGRNRFVATASTMVSLFSKHNLLKVELVVDGKINDVKTPMIFIGNNALQLRDLEIPVARCMKEDMLAVVMMKPITKLETLRIVLRGIMKSLSKEERLENFCVDELLIHADKHSELVALDGEMIRMTQPYKIRSLPGELNLVLHPANRVPA